MRFPVPRPLAQKDLPWINFLYFSKKKNFLIFWHRTFQAQAQKILYIFPKKNYYISRWKSPAPSSRSQKKPTLKKFLIFFQKTFSHVSRWLLMKHKNENFCILQDDCWLSGVWKNLSWSGMTAELVFLANFLKISTK